jgi:flagellar hook-associated protein 1 FlgK
MGARSLQVQQQGVEVAGHNIANVNTPGYSRQRLNIATSLTIPTPIGPQGTGAQSVAIQRLHDDLLDGQIQTETSVQGFLDRQQQSLQQAQGILGQEIDRAATGPDGSAAPLGVGGQHGIAEKLSDLFNAFQAVSTDPTSIPERQAVLIKGQDLAAEFNAIDLRLAALNTAVDKGIQSDVGKANDLLTSIAELNKQIFTVETRTSGAANDLRDLRQQRIEDLAKFVPVQTVEQANGTVDISIDGQLLVSGVQITDRLETYDAGGGQLLVRTQTGGAPLNLTSGGIQGLIDARDGTLATLRTELNGLASLLVTEVNAIHQAGFSLTGSTGAAFFTGTNASDLAVNAALAADPALFQAGAVNGAVGDNRVALALAQLAETTHAALSNQTFSQGYSGTVARFGQALASVNSSLADQSVIGKMLARQRDSVSGVSLDEEMTDMIKYQRAFEASARLITTIDETLQEVVNLKR